jgi:hypothetical protein
MGGSNPKNVLGAICFAASDSVANRQRACERELHPAAAGTGGRHTGNQVRRMLNSKA